MSTKKFLQEGLIFIVLLGAGLLSALDTFAQSMPISQRVLPKYNITVSVNKKPVVILVMNKRLDDGNKMMGMHDYMLKTFTKYCSEGCDEKVRGDIREKIMKEAMKRRIDASHVIFK